VDPGDVYVIAGNPPGAVPGYQDGLLLARVENGNVGSPILFEEILTFGPDYSICVQLGGINRCIWCCRAEEAPKYNTAALLKQVCAHRFIDRFPRINRKPIGIENDIPRRCSPLE
jgi:hypothetical protein